MNNEQTNRQLPGLWLAMDTSTASMTVALLEDGKLLGAIDSRVERNHSLYLVPHIQQLLKDCGRRTDDLQGLAAGVGPGSYTGVRIGVTVAKTMAWTLGRPAVGISSLEAMALGASEPHTEIARDMTDSQDGAGAEAVTGHERPASAAQSITGTAALALAGETEGWAADELTWYVPLMNARRGQVYTGLFTRGTEGWERLEEDRIVLFESWLDMLRDRLNRSATHPVAVCFVGETDLFAEAAQRLEDCEGDWRGQVVIRPHFIRAFDIGRLAGLVPEERRGADVHGLVPNYTQLAEAEVNLLAKSGGGGRDGADRRA